jgi:hypothetical protein
VTDATKFAALKALIIRERRKSGERVPAGYLCYQDGAGAVRRFRVPPAAVRRLVEDDKPFEVIGSDCKVRLVPLVDALELVEE